jgi:CHAT domain-containing protein/tetratricopeptide (TPR) repeat protein
MTLAPVPIRRRPLALAVALLLCAGELRAQRPTPIGRATERAAEQAVDGDSAARVRARLEAALGRRPDDALTRLALADLLRLTYSHVAARAEYGRLLVQDVDATVLGRAQFGLADSWRSAGRYDSMVIHARAAVEIARSAGDRTTEAQALAAISRALFQLATRDSADAYIRRALAVVPPGSPDVRAYARCWRAWLHLSESPARSEALTVQGSADARRVANARADAYCLLVRAATVDIAGQHVRALRLDDEAVAAARRTGDAELLSTALANQASDLLLWSSRLGEGRRAADGAFRAAQVSGRQSDMAWARLHQARLALRLGDVAAGDTLLGDVERRLQALGDDYALGATYDAMGELHWLSRQLPEAYSDFERGALLFRKLGREGLVARMRRLQAGVLRQMGQLAAAGAHLAQAESLATSHALAGVLSATVYERGLLALAEGRFDDAVTLLDRYRRTADPLDVNAMNDVRMRLAEAHAGAGRLDATERELQSANANLARWRASFSDRGTRLVLQEGIRLDYDPDLGVATIVNALARGGRVDAALRAVEDRRAQQLWTQMLRRWQWRDAAEGSGPAPTVPTNRLDDLPGVLPDSTALAVFVTGRGGEPTTLFTITRLGMRAQTLTTGDSLAVPIERFVTLLAAGRSADALARTLGRAVLQPIEQAVGPGITRLVLVPDGPLHRLPFDALQLGDGRPALDRYAIALAPSARIARSWWTRPAPAARHGVLIFADPAYDPSAGLARLAASADEGRGLQGRGTNVRLLTREAASEAALKRAPLDELGVLHLATHARVQDVGLTQSALYLAPGGGEDGRVGPEELATLHLGVDLVVLSACHTAGGPIMAGEGVQGLTAPLLEAGARAVAATYWEVGDRTIAPLVQAFYAGLAAGRPVGQALHEAKTWTRRQGSGPAVWAAFALVGDPAARPGLGP